jgi:hypothetical protein
MEMNSEMTPTHGEFHDALHDAHRDAQHDAHQAAHESVAVEPRVSPASVAPANGNGVSAHTENGVAAAEARGILDGIAESLRTLAGRQGHDGAPVAIFPRGVDVLEVRMHISRDQDVDVNLRVAGPAHPALDVS